MNQLTLSECSKRREYIENYIKKLVAQNRTTNWMLKNLHKIIYTPQSSAILYRVKYAYQ